MPYRIVYSKQALKDLKKIKMAGLSRQAHALIVLIEENPYATPPTYEKLVGNLRGMYSRRISIQHRLVYAVYEEERVVKILRMWTHYE